jgi:hypothetical protein
MVYCKSFLAILWKDFAVSKGLLRSLVESSENGTACGFNKFYSAKLAVEMACCSREIGLRRKGVRKGKIRATAMRSASPDKCITIW